MRRTGLYTTAVMAAIGGLLGCSKHDAANGSVAQDSGSAAANGAAPARATSAGASADSIVRGTIASVSDSTLTLSTPGGSLRVTVSQPIKVYSRQSGDLSRVTDHSFVGVTSVSEPDGTQRATEIHVFPEELRGLGEGSRPMATPAAGARSTMTNGSVANSRMTNGAAHMTNGAAHMTNGAAHMTNGAARMTNGASRGVSGGTMTVEYNGGSQTITVPAGVTVTVIAPTSAKLTPGTDVIVPASKQPDGSLRASFVMLTAAQNSR